MTHTAAMAVAIRTAHSFAILLLVGLLARLFLIWHLPFTFDEGAYLYDARTLATGVLSGGDVLAKSPVVALLLTAVIKLIGPHLFVGRAVSLFAGIGTAIALYVVGRQLQNRRLGLAAAMLWLLASAPLALTIYGTTHAVALALAITTVALWLTSLQRLSLKTAFLVGICFALAYAARKTMLATAVPLMLLWLIYQRPYQLVLAASTGSMFILLPWLTGMYYWYGWAGVIEAVGWGYSQIAEQYISKPASITGWGGGWARFGKVAIQLVTPLALLAVWNVRRRPAVVPLAVGIVWLVVMFGLYSLWPAVLPDYLADLLPALVILSAIGAQQLFLQPPLMKWSVAGIILVINVLGLWSAYVKPWAGNYTRQELYVASEQLSALIPRNEPVLTAAVIAPYLSGHRVWADIAHPLWYRYNFIDTGTRQVFLPSREDIKRAYINGDINWVLTDRLTSYAYFSDFLQHPAKEPARWQAHSVGSFQLYSVLK